MKIIIPLLFVTYLFGQLAALPLAPGVTMYAHDIVLLTVLVLGVVSSIRGKKIIRPKLTGEIILFCGIGVISLLVNIFRFSPYEMGIASLYLLRFTVYACLYMVLVQGYMASYTLLRWLFWTGTTVSMIGFVQYLWYPELRNLLYLGWDPHFLRLFSTFFDPNFTGIILACTIILGIHVWQRKQSKYIVAGIIISIVGLYLTFSRSSYLALVAGVLTYALMKKQWKMIFAVVLFILAVIVIPKPGGHTLLLTRIPSTFARIGNWKESLTIISGAPVLGYGFNTLRYVYRTTHTDLAPGPVSKAAAGLDSSLLFVLATTGIIGFLAYSNLLVSWVRLSLKNTKSRTFYISTFIALMVHSCFTNSLFYPWVMVWFWIMTAAAELEGKNVTSGN
jgi:O-antigen ligase